MNTIPLRHVADVWVSNVDKLTTEGEAPVQLCNYVDVYKNDVIRPNMSLMRATARADEIKRFHLEVGDTLLTKDSEDPTDIGVSAFVAETADDMVCGYHLAIARPRAGTHPRYLTWATRTRPVLNHFTNSSNGISRYGLSTSGLMAAPIPLPTFEEQRRIADFLDDRVARIDQIIAARQQQRASIDSAFRALEYRLTTTGRGETQPTRIEWMPRIASSSRLWRLSRAFATGSGTTPRSDSTEYYGEGTPWVTTSDLRDNRITELPRSVTDEAFRDYSALKTFPAGTLLIAMYGATVGRLGILDCAAATNQACCAMLPLGPVDTSYAFHWLHAQRPHIVALASGGGQPNISQEVVRSLYIPAPDIELQNAVVAELARYESTAKEADTTLARQISLLQEYKQSLITAAVTGEFDITTASTRIPE